MQIRATIKNLTKMDGIVKQSLYWMEVICSDILNKHYK